MVNRHVNDLAPQEAYALWAAGYPPRPHNPLMEAEQAAIETLLPDVAGRTALDAGCGTGRYARLLEQRGARVTGLDLSASMLGHAPGLGGRLVRGSLVSLPFASRSFDVIVSGLALNDVAPLAPVLGELARVLRPGGRLVYSVIHPSGEAKGWLRTFAAGGRQLAVAGFWHSAEAHRAGCATAALTVDEWREPHLGDPANPVALVVSARR